MKGSHRTIVQSRKIKYDFTIKRNMPMITRQYQLTKLTND